MARQRPTRLVMGPCIVEIDHIVIREIQYKLEVNRCRNEEVIVKGNFGWVWPMWAGRPRIEQVNRCRNEEIIVKGNFGWLVMGPCIVDIDRIVIREVQYQVQVNWCRNEEVIVKGNFGWVWSMWAGCPRAGHGAMHKVQYQLEVNRCRNEEIIVKGNFGWVWPMWVGCPRIDRIFIREVQYQFDVIGPILDGSPGLVMGPCIFEIDRIVIREVQYQFEVNRCRNEEIIVKGNVGWAWSMWEKHPRIDRIIIRNVQYQFEVNRCRNKEVNLSSDNHLFQGSNSGQEGRTERRTDGQMAEITTISPRFSKSGASILGCDGWTSVRVWWSFCEGVVVIFGANRPTNRPTNRQGKNNMSPTSRYSVRVWWSLGTGDGLGGLKGVVVIWCGGHL
ncbi:hypothetical protein DPMN_102625 [Dreissena polymorpha]|uniref:Uncharacterized protein n=1 Tax=Dreissena polymorpha TaxID=45954 RepID=A0A9D4RAP6_DREPO|nr:hypothetical protein DPMN_102625 [Dreissena polymorpha]